MTLGDLFEQLALGELSQHNIGSSGQIQEKDYPKLISHLNLALTAVHTLLPLKENEVVVQQYDHITEYRLSAVYAQSNPDPDIEYKWIVDTVESPFTEDILRIEAVFNEVGGPVPLNDEYDNTSMYSPAPDLLQIPFPVSDNAIVLVYRANHPKIPLNTTDLTTLVDIPTSIQEAVQAYMASRLYVALANPTSAQLSSYYNRKFKDQIAIVERYNTLQSSDTESNIMFRLGGWK